MSASPLLLLALVARLAPPGWGLLAAGVALLAGAERAPVAGLVLLATAGPLGALADAARAPPTSADVPAVRLVGTWRTPPGGDPFLDTEAGPVAVRLADGVSAPGAGVPVDALARVDAGGAATLVALVPTGPPAGAWLDRWRAAAAARVRRLARSHRGLVEALLLGRRDDLSPVVRDDCRATGTMHLLALSGLHVALLAGLVARVPGAGRAGRLLVLAVVAGFVGLAGSRPSLLRAALGWTALVAGRAGGRQASPLHRLGAVALVLAVVAPGLASDLGAQLSFLAVAGLVGAARLHPLVAPAGAFLATAPLVLEVFGRVQPWGLVVTPVLLPCVAGVLAAGAVAVLPGDALAALDPLAAPVLRGAAAGLAWTVHLAAWVCPPPLRPPPFPLPGLVVSLAVVAALAVLPLRPGRAEVAT